MAAASSLTPHHDASNAPLYEDGASRDLWDKAADQYDSMIGQVTIHAAKTLVELAHQRLKLDRSSATTTTGGTKISAIDLGAGTGSVTLSLLRRFPKLDLIATDQSGSMMRQLRQSAELEFPGLTTLRTAVVDMSDPFTRNHGGSGQDAPTTISPLQPGAYSHVFTSCALHFAGNNEACFRGMYELLAPSGCCAAGAWDFLDDCMPLIIWRESATRADPGYDTSSSISSSHDRCRGLEDLQKLMLGAGFQNIVTERVTCNMGKDGKSDDFYAWFWESGNPWPEGLMKTYRGNLDKVKAAMRDLLREKYPTGIHVKIAIAVGSKPASA